MIEANNYEEWERIGDRIFRGDIKICDAVNGEDTDDYEANAKMITQAPRLLRCLKWATTFAAGSMEGNESLQNPTFQKWVAECRAVIDAATHYKPARPEVVANAEELFRVLNTCLEYIEDTRAAMIDHWDAEDENAYDNMLTQIFNVVGKIERQRDVATRD